MTDDHCKYCGHLISPCANCGGAEGRMIRADNHSDVWIHQNPADCIAQMQSELREAHTAIAALQAALERSVAPQEPTL